MTRCTPFVVLSIAACYVLAGCGRTENATPNAKYASAAEGARREAATEDVEQTPGANTTVGSPAQLDQTTSAPRRDRPGASRRKSNDGVVEMTFDDIKFEIEQSETFRRDMLSPQIEALFGRSVRLRGYMLPTMRRTGIKQFVLVRDNQECCFGPGAAIYDCVLIQMNNGATVDYSIRPVAVEGALRFRELKDPVTGQHLAVYQIEGDSVE